MLRLLCLILFSLNIIFSSTVWAVDEDELPEKKSAGSAGKTEVENGQSQLEQAKKNTEALQQLEASKKSLEGANEKCNKAAEAAKSACVESMSPILGATMKLLTAAMQSQQGSAGANGNCSAANNAQQQGKDGLSKYTADCNAKKSACTSACKSAESSAETVSTATCKTDALKIPDKTQQAMRMKQCQEAANSTKSASSSTRESCESLGKNSAAGAAGIAEMLAGLMQSQACKDQTGEDCQKNPNSEKCKLDCNLAANAANPKCICEKNPRAGGCGGDTSVADSDQSKEKDIPGGGSPGPGAGLDSQNSNPNSSSDGGGGNAPYAPGGGAGGGSLGKGSPEQGSEKKKSVDTNILGGDYGGSSATTSGHGGYSDEENGKYSAYLPKKKGDRDPSSTDKNQVTSAFGPSIWEKVNRGYREKASSLITK